MTGSDATLICRDCGGGFAVSEDERRSFAAQGHLHSPSRCSACRDERKARQAERGARPAPPRFRELSQTRSSIVCTACGQPAVVPFEARANRAVYCSDCYRRRRADGADA
jgi:CxxC-x17-CxxC domain-containing protein